MAATIPFRSRNWCFTCNNYSDEDLRTVCALDHNYLVTGFETGESGTPHIQGYIELPNGKTFKALKKALPNFHLEARKGTALQASGYCKKDGKYEEYGVLTAQGKRNDIKAVVDDISLGKSFEDILDNHTTYQALQIAKVAIPYKEPKRDWVPEVYWYWGPPGTGKSHAAYTKFPDLRCHIQDPAIKWYDGYDRHEVVILDDFRSHHMSFTTLLHILDRYPYKVETKGGTRQFVPKKIFITTPETPEFTFRHLNENLLQLTRRITEVQEFDTFYVAPYTSDDAGQDSSAPHPEQEGIEA